MGVYRVMQRIEGGELSLTAVLGLGERWAGMATVTRALFKGGGVWKEHPPPCRRRLSADEFFLTPGLTPTHKPHVACFQCSHNDQPN